MRKILFVLLLSVGYLTQLEAQEVNKFRFDIRLGYATPTNGGGGGALLNLEPKWTISDNMNVGLRLGIAAYGRAIDGDPNADAEIGANASYVGTYDYYFHNGSSSFAPFVGGGLGYFAVANVEINDSQLGPDENEVGSNGKFGAMLRAGFDVGKFRLAAEYNIIGKSDVRDVSNQVIGESKNGYIGISVGAYFGGGKWKK